MVGPACSRRALLTASLGLCAAPVVLPGSAGAACKPRLTRAELDESLALGQRFLVNSQRDDGRFEYELDWHTMSYSPDDHPVRQAGAAWGLALVYRDGKRREVRVALERALRFFADCTRVRADGARYIVYPGQREGAIGTVALTALALIEYLRVRKSARHAAQLGGYLLFLAAARRDEGSFAAAYDDDGEVFGEGSPYYDGESLLALVKAARYRGKRELLPAILAEADSGYERYVTTPLASAPNPDDTKAYYHWSSLAYFELYTWRGAGRERDGERLLSLTDWMLDVHRPLIRRRNTAYAFEGIIPAYAAARSRGDTARVAEFGCAINRGLRRLTSWQVGHSLANPHILANGPPDEQAIGGVQNHKKQPALRIDVTQHQMHAVLLARHHYLRS